MYFSFKENVLRTLYNILTYVANFHLKIIALFNAKLKLGVRGRAQTFETLKKSITEEDQTIWFHCASLGEYEQGLPVFEEIKALYPRHKIVLSFFSPSGYEIKKNAPVADVVIYLPLDTKRNARQFLNLSHPDLILFVKYEIWPNYLHEIKTRGIKSVLISAIFRKEHNYFKPTGKWMLQSLKAFDKIFVQNETSKDLLEERGFTNCVVSGDTRFDRVNKQLEVDNKINFIEKFIQDKLCIVAGSTWPEDDKLCVNYINKAPKEIKFIIAPHNIKSVQISNLKKSIQRSVVLFSEKEGKVIEDYQVLVLDTIGLLSKVYSYASIAYVGGAYGTSGLHNTLEAAIFGVPIVIGGNYSRFPEAHDMINNGGMFSILHQDEFNTIITSLIDDEELRISSGTLNYEYIKKNTGAVVQILDYIRR
jgi:3-deoxy-D-manno-octulosonic-acid transferase